jgi:hypothetical protein
VLIVVLIDCFHHGDGQMSFEVLPLCQYRCLRTVLRVQSSTGTSSHDSTLEATVIHYVAPVPWSMYRTYGTAKYWEYDSTLEATVQHYLVHVPWSMYRTYGTAKYWEYDSTLEATVQHYLVHVLLSTYCTHVAIKYWEYDSTLVGATVYYNTFLCLLYGCRCHNLVSCPTPH